MRSVRTLVQISLILFCSAGAQQRVEKASIGTILR